VNAVIPRLSHADLKAAFERFWPADMDFPPTAAWMQSVYTRQQAWLIARAVLRRLPRLMARTAGTTAELEVRAWLSRGRLDGVAAAEDFWRRTLYEALFLWNPNLRRAGAMWGPECAARQVASAVVEGDLHETLWWLPRQVQFHPQRWLMDTIDSLRPHSRSGRAPLRAPLRGGHACTPQRWTPGDVALPLEGPLQPLPDKRAPRFDEAVPVSWQVPLAGGDTLLIRLQPWRRAVTSGCGCGGGCRSCADAARAPLSAFNKANACACEAGSGPRREPAVVLTWQNPQQRPLRRAIFHPALFTSPASHGGECPQYGDLNHVFLAS